MEQIKIILKEKEIYQNAKSSIEKLEEENKTLSVKILLKEKEIYQNAKSSIEKLEEENKALGEEIRAVNDENINLNVEIINLKEEVRLSREAITNLKEQMNKGARSKILKKLKEEIASLKKEKKDLSRSLKRSEREIGNGEKREEKLNNRLVDTGTDMNKLQDEFGQLQEAYKAFLLENKGLKEELDKMPKKFAEMAYENQKLIKQTATLHYNTGVLYFLHKEYKLAIQEFDRALEIYPDDANAHYNLGFIYAENLIDKPKAIKHFKKYLRITKGLDEYANKAKQYILVWEAYREKEAR